MVPGISLSEIIKRYLQEADIILLLISPDYIASHYCATEMRQAIALHNAGKARVIPILLRPTDWRWLPIWHLLVLPGNARPISVWPSQDEAWTDVARGIRLAIEELGKN
jgi:hypothetical protein